MIFEVIAEISSLEIISTVILVLCFFIILAHMWIYLNRKYNKHNSYHKGYNQAKDDKVQYYATLKILIDDFKKILSNLKQDFIKLPLETTTLIVNYNNKLQELYDN